jgi:hypothetical protein
VAEVMIQTVRLFLLVEGFAFSTAALTHFGLLFPGYYHHQASIAESVIACALFIGAGISFARPSLIMRAGLVAQAFALFGTLVGIFTIVVGVGPRTVPDVIYHILMVILLATGIAVIVRGREIRPSGGVV